MNEFDVDIHLETCRVLVKFFQYQIRFSKDQVVVKDCVLLKYVLDQIIKNRE